MPNFCCVVGCPSRGDRDKVSFFRIPKILVRRQKRIHAIRRASWSAKSINNARVCSQHFVSGKPSNSNECTDIDWVPSQNLGYDAQKILSTTPRVKRRKILITDQLPISSENNTFLIDQPSTSSENNTFLIDQPSTSSGINTLIPEQVVTGKYIETDLTGEAIENLFNDYKFINTRLYETRSLLEKSELNEISFINDPRQTKYYTGFQNFRVLQAVLKRIQPQLSNNRVNLSPFQQLLLTLMKLRLNLDFQLLAFTFKISPSTVSYIFQKTIMIMYYKFKSLIKWPDAETRYKSLPKCFKDSPYNKTTVIIDCFEVLMEKPANLLTASKCWSNYKHSYTAKFLIGITPQGTISFISDAWGGRASDKHITENSGFLEKITADDIVLADRGFLLQNILDQNNLIVPAFTKGHSQLHPLSVEYSRSVANVRIHVERVIGLLRRRYRIFHSKLPISLIANGDGNHLLVDKMVVVCAALINLGPPIIPLD